MQSSLVSCLIDNVRFSLYNSFFSMFKNKQTMRIKATPFDGDLFYESLIESYVNAPRFVERPWLAARIEAKLAEPNSRFLLLTAEPGAGKTAFMAWLAHQHSDWCRYFIRRDQRTPLGDVGAHSFLLQVGFQLAASHPDLFQQDQVKIAVQQRIGLVDETGEVVGAEIDKLVASPFYQKVVQIKQKVDRNQGKVVAIRIKELYSDNRSIPIENLQYWALIDPAISLSHLDQNQRIVVLVDALDELRYRDAEKSLLKWLAGCPELPANLRFILTSRPDNDLLNDFLGSKQCWLQKMTIEEEDPKVRGDLIAYAGLLVQVPEVKALLEANNQAVDKFVQQATNKANGNFGYLDAIGRAVDQAINVKQQERLQEILNFSALPDTLQDLYAFFLGRLKNTIDKEKALIEDSKGEIGLLPVWPAIYKPIIGLLAVSREPLALDHIQKLGNIQFKFDYLTRAIENLDQFLDHLGNTYRLYHTTLAEFITSPNTRDSPEYAYCYVNPTEQNQSIVNYYRQGKTSWEAVDLKQIAEDAYGRHHIAHHLVQSGRIDELHNLLTLEVYDERFKKKRPAWFDMKARIGDTAGFLEDVRLAWTQAEQTFDCNPGQSIGQQCRYALIVTSVNSLAGNIPPALPSMLLKKKIWEEPSQGLAYARQIPDPEQRAEALAGLAPYLDEALKDKVLQEALAATQTIKDHYWRQAALIRLYPKLPKLLLRSLLREPLPSAQVLEDAYKRGNIWVEVKSNLSEPLEEDQLRKALAATRLMENEPDKVDELTKLAPHLPAPLLQKALEIANAIQGDFQHTLALARLGPRLVELGRKQELLSAAQTIEYTHRRTVALTRLVPHVSELVKDRKLKKALAEVLAIADEHWQAEALTELAEQTSHFPEQWQDEVLQKALAVAQTIGDEHRRAEALVTLAIYLAELSSQKEALDAVRGIKDERWRAEALTELAEQTSHFPEQWQDKLFREALDAVREIKDERWQTEILVRFPKLPEPLLREAQAQAQGIDDEYCRTRVMLWLALNLTEPVKVDIKSGRICVAKIASNPFIPALERYIIKRKRNDLLKKAWRSAQRIKNEHMRIAALVKLSPHLPEPLLREVLRDTKEISDEDDQAQLLARLALCFAKLNHPQKALDTAQEIENTDQYWYAEALAGISMCLAELGHLTDARETAQKIKYRHWQIITLARLTPYLSRSLKEEELRKTLSKAQAIAKPNEQARVLGEITPYFPKLLLKEALLTARAIKDEDSRKVALGGMIPHLAKLGDSQEALKLVEQELTDGYWKTIALAGLIPYLPEDKRGEVLKKALVGVQAVSNTDKLPTVMAKLNPFVDTLQTTELHPCLCEMLQGLAFCPREKLLTTLRTFSPVIVALGGSEGAAETARAILDVGRWWP